MGLNKVFVFIFYIQIGLFQTQKIMLGLSLASFSVIRAFWGIMDPSIPK